MAGSVGVAPVLPKENLMKWFLQHKIISAILVIVVLIIFGNALTGKNANSGSVTTTVASGGSGTTSTTQVASAPPSTTFATTTAVPVSQIGQTVKDGDFAFVVKSVSCGASAAAAVNDGGIGESVPAGAQECLVTMTVNNDKAQAQTFFDSNQYAYDAAGHQLSADTTGSIYLSGSNDATQVNPGVTITAIVTFQIPASDTITSLELHDSAFSAGVKVFLG